MRTANNFNIDLRILLLVEYHYGVLLEDLINSLHSLDRSTYCIVSCSKKHWVDESFV